MMVLPEIDGARKLVPKKQPYIRRGTQKDLTRAQAQFVLDTIQARLGRTEKLFCRKKSKSKPESGRKEIGMRRTVPPFRVIVVHAAKTWREAIMPFINDALMELGDDVPPITEGDGRP